MKKTILFIGILLLVLFFSACNINSTDTTNSIIIQTTTLNATTTNTTSEMNIVDTDICGSRCEIWSNVVDVIADNLGILLYAALLEQELEDYYEIISLSITNNIYTNNHFELMISIDLTLYTESISQIILDAIIDIVSGETIDYVDLITLYNPTDVTFVAFMEIIDIGNSDITIIYESVIDN